MADKLESVISDAIDGKDPVVEEVAAPAPEGEVERDPEGETEGEPEPETEGEPEVEDEESPEDAKQAKILFKALKDPAQRKEVLLALARQEGLEMAETKKEVKAIKKSVRETLENALGPELKFLAEKLGPAMDSILEEERQERVQESERLEAVRTQENVQKALDDLSRDTKGDSRKLEAKMSSLAEKYLPSSETSPKEYVKMLYTLASAGKADVKAALQITDKINRNAKDVAGRLRATTSPSKESSTKPPPEGMKGLDKIVNWAVQQQQSGK